MSSSHCTTAVMAYYSICADSDVCHTQQPAPGGTSYNADQLEDALEEHFDQHENRRAVEARRGKMARRADWN